MEILLRSRVRKILLCTLVAGLTLAGVSCGGSSGSGATTTSAAPTTTVAPTTTAVVPATGGSASATTTVTFSGEEAKIAANWVKFFDGSVAPQDKVGLLENGTQYQKQLESNAASPLAKLAGASVSAVTIASPTTATVKYSILIGGHPALPDQTGKALLQDGVWKVGSESFLALLALQGASGATTTTSK